MCYTEGAGSVKKVSLKINNDNLFFPNGAKESQIDLLSIAQVSARHKSVNDGRSGLGADESVENDLLRDQ